METTPEKVDKFCLSTQILTGSWVCRQLDEVDAVDRQNLAINGQGGSVQSGDEKIIIKKS